MAVTARAGCLLVLFLVSVVYGKGPIKIASITRDSPSSNTHIVYDTTQILVVDAGREERDANAIIAAVGALQQTGRNLTAVFLTHGHPDHVMAVWKVNQAFSTTPIYVSTQDVKNELINVMYTFAPFLNQSSPGNPLAKNASFHFNYNAMLKSFDEPFDPSGIWDGNELQVLTEFPRVGESFHYAMIAIPTINALITGDLIYVKAHLYMGWDVSLTAQCDWIAGLNLLVDSVPPQTLLYPGHGPVGLPHGMTASDVAQQVIDYIQFARSVYVNTCDVNYAISQISAKYPDFIDLPLLSGLSAPMRVPADATSLGCPCNNGVPQICNISPPPCTFAGY